MTPGSHQTIQVADFPGIEHAACADTTPNLWFPERGDMQSVRAAQTICHTCPCRVACLEYGIEHETYGLWGGATEGERRRIRRQRRLG